MKNELLKPQWKPLLCFGLPVWGLTIAAIYTKLDLLFYLLIAMVIVYVIMAMVNATNYSNLYKIRFGHEYGRRPLRYVEGEDELNKYYAISWRWTFIFFGVPLSSLIACFCPIE